MGGGTDYPYWFRQHGGAVLSCTIDQYAYISLRRMPPFLGTKYRVFWSQSEAVDRLEDIRHNGVRGCLQYLKIEDGIEVNHAGDLPARSGLGSSSCFTVGMLHACHAMMGRYVPKSRLAQEAIVVEQDVLRETVGVQDQIECAHGGLNYVEIRRDGGYELHPVPMTSVGRRALEDRLVLVFTGLQRYATEIAAAQVTNAERKEAELHAIAAMVPRAMDALAGGRLDDFGRMLHEAWMVKRELSDKVTTPEIDALYDRARHAGALGGKVLGAGGGGFMLLYVRPADWSAVAEALEGAITVPVRFQWGGSQIVLYDPGLNGDR